MIISEIVQIFSIIQKYAETTPLGSQLRILIDIIFKQSIQTLIYHNNGQRIALGQSRLKAEEKSEEKKKSASSRGCYHKTAPASDVLACGKRYAILQAFASWKRKYYLKCGKEHKKGAGLFAPLCAVRKEVSGNLV